MNHRVSELALHHLQRGYGRNLGRSGLRRHVRGSKKLLRGFTGMLHEGFSGMQFRGPNSRSGVGRQFRQVAPQHSFRVVRSRAHRVYLKG